MNVATEHGARAGKADRPLGREESSGGADTTPSSQRTRILIPILLTAGLLWCSYFPLNLGWLGWVALVPFLVLVRVQVRARRLYTGAFFAGLLFYLASLQWMRVADYRMYATWIGLAIACALFVPVALLLTRRLDQRTRLPLIVSFPLVWTALEYVRAHLFTGFPWYFLSHTQHDFLPMIQIADITGAYGVTFVLAAANGLIFEILYSSLRFRNRLGLVDQAGPPVLSLRQQGSVAVLVLGGVLAYGYWRLSEKAFASGPVIGLIQGNLEQSVRNDATADIEEAIEAVRNHYIELTDLAMIREPKPSLLIWPETSYPDEWLETSTELAPQLVSPRWAAEVRRRHNDVRRLAASWRADWLMGVNCSVLLSPKTEVRYNSAVFTKANGQIAGRYDKIHCVPFGEYVPLKDWLPVMKKFAPYDFDYSVDAGNSFTRFSHGDCHFGVLICYEDTDPYLARQYVRSDTGGPPVDFLVDISNDGWFHGTSEHEEHLAICRFRAIECRRAVARAVNMGISAVIDANGRVTALPGPTWAQSKNIAAVLPATIPLDTRTSLYALWGDWFVWGCWAIIGGYLVWTIFRPLPSSPTTHDV